MITDHSQAIFGDAFSSSGIYLTVVQGGAAEQRDGHCSCASLYAIIGALETHHVSCNNLYLSLLR